MKKLFNRFIDKFSHELSRKSNRDDELLALGKILCNQQQLLDSDNLSDYEFSIFSQFGDDGILQYLSENIHFENESFVEFGVESYHEATTRFLLMNNNWSGYVIDGSEANMKNLQNQKWFYKYDIRCKSSFITAENINELMAETGFKNLGILHIDIDGNDYHVLNAMDLKSLNPSLLILEYNALFGKERAITVPYKSDFNRTEAHYSNLYFGASLPALNYLAEGLGYSLIYCTKNGNNAYFLKNELLTPSLKKVPIQDAFMPSKFRESRNANGELTFLNPQRAYQEMRGLSVLNVLTGKEEVL